MLNDINHSYVNLDLVGGQWNPSVISTMEQWEAVCPLATYRFVLGQYADSNNIISAINDCVSAVQTGEIHNWKGFLFDVEDSVTQDYAGWMNDFYYAANKTQQTGVPIPMVFAGDGLVMENLSGDNLPSRFSDYVVEVYYGGPGGTEPFTNNGWTESYSVQQYVSRYVSQVPNSATPGIFLGITNMSCYGRDVSQPIQSDWGNASGEDNLIRDVLIAKSFGIPQISFFSGYDAIDGDYDIGGLWHAYGDDFLAQLNNIVNVNPPTNFSIDVTPFENPSLTTMITDPAPFVLTLWEGIGIGIAIAVFVGIVGAYVLLRSKERDALGKELKNGAKRIERKITKPRENKKK
jgi:hypothetical protein